MITFVLVYLMIGSLIWMVLDGLGIIEHSFMERVNASGRALVLASVMMIVLWPWFVVEWIKSSKGQRS